MTPPAAYPASGPWAPPTAAPAKPDTTLGTLAYVLTFVAGWIGPLIIYLVAKKEDKFNRFHAMQALLLSVVQFIVWIPFILFAMAPIFGLPFFFGTPGDPDAFAAGFGAMFGVFFAFAIAACGLSILFMVLYIVGAVKANRGEMWQMAVIGRLADSWS